MVVGKEEGTKKKRVLKRKEVQLGTEENKFMTLELGPVTQKK